MTYEDLPSQAFSDPRNITIGTARIIWASKCGRLDEGWVIPGGWRTQNRFTANAAAQKIAQLTLNTRNH